jgi:long-chain acyl-CoA synthetase
MTRARARGIAMKLPVAGVAGSPVVGTAWSADSFDDVSAVEETIARITSPEGRFAMREVAVGTGTVRAWAGGPRTLREVASASAGYGAATFLVSGDRRLSFADHLHAVAALADHLVSALGVQPGDRVAIAMRNVPEWSVAFWAVTAIDAIAVPLNAWWTGEELAFALADSGSRILIADHERLDRLSSTTGLGPVTVHTIVAGPEARADRPSLASIVAAASDAVALPEVEVTEDDAATLFYTSGTTGRPRGVLGTHRNMVSNLLSRQFYRELDSALTGRPLPASGGVTLLTVPLFHVTGSHSYLLPALASGSTLVLMPRWDVDAALGLIERERVTSMGGVPFMALQLADAYRRGKHDLSSLGALAVGGAPAPPSLVTRLAAALPRVVSGNGYGMTETSATAVYNYGDDYRRRPESIGRVVPIMDMRIVDDDGADVPAGQAGELWLRGANVATGYWRRPEETAVIFLDGGWLRTGDLARVDDDGMVTLVGRQKEIIVRGGENIAPVQVEAVLIAHPAVLDAAVVGIPHPLLGEEVGALVQVTDSGAVDGAPAGSRADVVDAAELQRHVGAHLAAFNVPTQLLVTDRAIPRSPQGKVSRAEVLRLLGQ